MPPLEVFPPQFAGPIPDLQTYRLLCGILSKNSHPQSELAAALSDSKQRSEIIRLASREDVLPSLHEAVAAHYSGQVSKQDRAVLAIEHEANRRHNVAIREAVVELAALANKNGIEVVALKGAVWVFEDEIGFAAWRRLVDVDILIDPVHCESIRLLLTQLGYAPFGKRRYRHHFHLIPYARSNRSVVIEVHRHVGLRPEFLPNELLLTGRQTRFNGLLLPPPWCAAFHAILHWQVQHVGYRRAMSGIKDVLEVSRYLDRTDIDWEMFISHAARMQLTGECTAAIGFATELFGAKAPAGICPSTRDHEHVQYCLRLRMSPARAWIRKEWARISALWRCDRSLYRMTLRGAGPRLTTTAIWMQRPIRFPFIVLRIILVLSLGAAKLLSEAVAVRVRR